MINDCGLQIVVAPPELHRQVITSPVHDASLTGEVRAPASHILPMNLDERRIIAHRAMLEISKPHTIVNLGIGMPEVNALICHHALLSDQSCNSTSKFPCPSGM